MGTLAVFGRRRPGKRRYRTVFLSDLHLGSSGARAGDLARFLRAIRCDKLYLVGDVLDLLELRGRWHWPAEHDAVIRRLLKMARKGTEVVYVPGNHDDAVRAWVGVAVGGVRVRSRDVHETADGRRLLVTHGDQYDLVVQHSPLLAAVGTVAYDVLVDLNRLWNRLRLALGLPHWSLARFVKAKVKRACTFVSRFEEALLQEARRRNLHGVVCGHVHKAEARPATGGDLAYFNCGDWVESCTALVERLDGALEIVDGLAFLAEVEAAGAETPARGGLLAATIRAGR